MAARAIYSYGFLRGGHTGSAWRKHVSGVMTSSTDCYLCGYAQGVSASSWQNPKCGPPNPAELLRFKKYQAISKDTKMKNQCAVYVQPDYTKLMRSKMRGYTENHYHTSKWFYEELAHSCLTPHDRPVLNRAARFCKNNIATLVLLKVRGVADKRLRSLIWLSEADFDFDIVEMPSLTPDNIQTACLFAADENNVISEKTRDALCKIRQDLVHGKMHISAAGNMITKLGAPDPGVGRKKKSELVLKRTMLLYNTHLKKMRADGLSFSRIADRLNVQGILPPFASGNDAKFWHSTSVRNYFLRGEINEQKDQTGGSEKV